MTLTVGTQLGGYEILAPIGAGGMGEVYRARDTKLGREVAIKVIPEAFTQDKERVSRFEREARLLASLNHPGIATIHGLEEEEDRQLLVMELVCGETLADRIARGTLPADEAIPLFKEISEALEAAHENGVIHRDLKPTNIKITPEGKIKLLDFGLAKAFEPEQALADSSQSPTLSKGTALGTIMGTASYMSPEQARGKPVDKRTDVWAFGCCLFEALTGGKAFEGEGVTEILAAVLKNEPDWSALPAETPSAIHQALRLSLRKDTKLRLRDIGDVRLALEGDLETTAESHRETVSERTGWQPTKAIAAALVLSVVSGVAVWNVARPEQEHRPVTRSHILLSLGDALSGIGRQVVALSPDDAYLVYTANDRLYLRAMDRLGETPMQGTEGARNPFFSPDGKWVGFWSDGQIKKISVSGVAPVTLCNAENLLGASWSAGDAIVYGQQGVGIMRVSADGGTPEVVITLEGAGEIAASPQVLPDQNVVIFTLGEDRWGEASIVAYSLDTGERKILIEGGRDARYVPTGHLVYVLNEAGLTPPLLAAPFDVDLLEVSGGSVAIAEGVWAGAGAFSTFAQFSFSNTGSLVYLIGSNFENALVWVDRQGHEEELAAEPRAYVYPRISPDGRRVALDVRDRERDIWIWNFDHETLTRFTFDPGADEYPAWTRDGLRLAFTSNRSGMERGAYWKAADGTGAVERLTEGYADPYTFTPDGKLVIRVRDQSEDLRLLSIDGSSEPLLVTEFRERNAELSPNGRFIAYQWNGSGEFEIYISPFPNLGDGRFQITDGGGSRPLWGPDGRELFYLARDGRLMVVSVQTEPSFEAGNAEIVVDRHYFTPNPAASPGRTYDISPDGKRFLMIKEVGKSASNELILVHNWFEELKQIAPVN